MLNQVTLQGRLTADPELRHTQNGTSVASFRIAVERNYKDAGTGKREADFFSCVAWRGTGELVSKYFQKGRMILLDGHLQNREYTDRNGVRRYVTEVVAEDIYFCDSKREETGTENPYAREPELSEMEDDGELPF
ncbi:MAG: single-stranded DNA-binding protein [Clostridia bacterium]|nr:single-stranded DNA-binding protein [Clostridia bacterium]